MVLGYVVRGPLGGMAWHHLQYVMGLAQLGHDVYFVEDSDDYPSCYDPTTFVTGTDPTYGLNFASKTFSRVGLGDRWAYFDAHTSQWRGPCASRILDICASADVVVNVSGVNPLRSWLRTTAVRILIDTDPAFTQIRNLTDPLARTRTLEHNAFFSFGENIRSADSEIPVDGIPWQSTRQPIVLDAWPVTPGNSRAPLTTIMVWESYRALEYDGHTYGMKSASFGPYLELPRSTEPSFELAIGGSTAPLELLREHGWIVRNPLHPTRNPWTYQRYIQRSKAEFSVAKHGYVASRSGWFSERSAAYLASGRAVVTQDTGFSKWLPVGSGVLAFDTLEEARAAVEDVQSRYEFHCGAARAMAEEYFDARRVLRDLLDRACALPQPVCEGMTG